MSFSRPLSRAALAATLAAFALLLVMPFALDALNTNPATGSAVRAVPVLGFYSADAQAISVGKQADKAAGQADFFCFAWSCTRRVRISAKATGGWLKTMWLLRLKGQTVFRHLECKTWVRMSIDVSPSGAVRSRLMACN